MADVYGVNTTKVEAGTGGDNWISQGLVKTRLKVWTDSYEAAALGIGQTIAIAELPVGKKIVDIKVYFDALGAASTLECGDATTSDLYIAATSTVSAGSASLDQIDGEMNELTDGEIILTVGGGAITGTIKTVVLYTD